MKYSPYYINLVVLCGLCGAFYAPYNIIEPNCIANVSDLTRLFLAAYMNPITDRGNSMYECEHFKAQELVDKALYEKRGDKAYQLFDDRLLKLIDELRELFGVSMTVNNWIWSGDRSQSGLRTAGSAYYSPTSQHSLGRAVDFLVKGMSADEARNKIEAWHNKNANGVATIAPSITMEAGVSWVHLDIRNNPDGVNYFNA